MGDDGSVPIAPSPLIGRSAELARGVTLLRERRLVTLVGPAGAGKTRLALELVHRAGSPPANRPAPAVFVDLVPLRDPAGVIPALARALDLGDGGARPLARTVAAELRSTPRLLLMDNVEHLRSAPPVVAELLAACPGVRIVATGRAALQVPGEHLLQVAPLPVPDLRDLPEPAEIAATAGVALFLDRVRAVLPDFELDASNARLVAEICTALDGLPLALELAAPHVRAHGLGQVLERTRRRFELLSRPRMAVPERHRSLAAAVRWSVDRLDPQVRDTFAQLSVFRGGWTSDAARAVCGPGAETALDELVEQSLVIPAATGTAGVRYRMLQTLHEWASEMLDGGGGADEVRERHRRWAAGFAAQVGSAFLGHDEAVWLDRADAEHANLHAALDRSPAGDPVGLRTAADLSWFWDVRGHLVHGRAQMERLLSRPGPDPVARARGLDALGRLAMYQSDHPAAVRALRESDRLARSRGDAAGSSWSTSTLAFSAFMTGRVEEAAELARTAVEDGRGAGPMLGRALCALAVTLAAIGRVAEAEDTFDACLQAVPGGASWARARTLYFRGWAARRAGDPRRAEALQGESATLLHLIGDRRSVADCVDVLGCAAVPDHPGRAVRCFAAAAAIRGRAGVARHPYLDLEVGPAEAAARDSLGPVVAAREWTAGARTEVHDLLVPPAATGARGTSPLTGRETEVARLIAEGLTNRRIGRRLGISERTAERHAENIRAKLGVRSRTEIAARVAGGTVSG